MISQKIMLITGLLLCLTVTTGCNSSQSKQTQQQEKEQPSNLVGNDQDNHGCIASAGYQWSELLKDCIRPFEKGIPLVSTTSDENQFAAYLVVNADSSKIEVFMHKAKKHPILTRNETKQTPVWESATYPNLSVTLCKNEWKILKGDKILYTQKVSEN